MAPSRPAADPVWRRRGFPARRLPGPACRAPRRRSCAAVIVGGEVAAGVGAGADIVEAARSGQALAQCAGLGKPWLATFRLGPEKGALQQESPFN